MGIQRNNFQRKEKGESTEKKLNEIEMSNLSDTVQMNNYKDDQGTQ